MVYGGCPIYSVSALDDNSVTLSGDHLDPKVYPKDLLNPIFSPSVRNLPSTLDGKLLNAVRQLTGSTENTLEGSATGGDELKSTIGSRALADTGTPRITAALVRDTARSGTNTDGITSDPTIAGKITDTNRIKSFEAGFNSTPLGKYFNVLPDLKPDGSFTLNRDRLQQFLGGNIPDGRHTLHLWAKDERGNSDKLVFNVSFTLDTQSSPAPTSLDLLTESDSGSSNSDNLTNNTTPIISGTAPSGQLVQQATNRRHPYADSQNC